MGERGPVPKRSSQRRRSNKPAIPTTPVEIPAAAPVPVPDSDQTWHPVARSWYEALAVSGQAQFYEPSDWATAVLLAESMSRDLSPQFVGFTEKGDVLHESIPLKGASLSAYLRGMSVLMVTEGDRRRVSLELNRAAGKDPDAERAAGTVTDIRSRLGGG
jgi:hypothetical protein